MASGDRQSRRELEATIEQQKEQLNRYETRLRDVVRAYKGLVKEKDALENSLTIISGSDGSDSKPSQDASSKPEESSDEDVGGRLQTLTASLATLTAQKSRFEAVFQEDKKKMRQEIAEKDEAMATLSKDLDKLKVKAKLDVDEAKSKLIVERHNRERETNDHALMLRELQKLVADERSGREKCESELDTCRDKLKALQLAGTFNAEYEKRVRELEGKLNEKDLVLSDLRAKNQQTPPELLRLHQQLADVKMSHSRDLERAEQRAGEAEERASFVRSQQESRVANLEARLQELSETVGTYDRLRQSDQVSIQKLKDRIAQLDRENHALQTTSPVSVSPDGSTFGDNDSNLDVQSLIERILRLRTLLRDANRRSENPVDLDELLDVGSDGESAKHWKKSYHQVKEELDNANETLNKYKKEPSKLSAFQRMDEEEMLALRSQIGDLKQECGRLRNQLILCEDKEILFKSSEAQIQVQLSELKCAHKEALEAKESDLKAKMLQLESEVQKQRERCLALIAEKEDEVATLKSNMELALETAFSAGLGGGGSPHQASSNQQIRAAAASIVQTASTRKRSSSYNQDVMDEVSQDLAQATLHQSDSMVLHYTEELSLKNKEVSTLRSRLFELESTMREVQMNALCKEEKYVDEIDSMREALTRLKRMTTKEGANLEYLKNVVLTYMLSSDAGSREHMLKAIGAVLMFSEAEIKRVRNYNASWWKPIAQQQQQHAKR